jgi:hypothetical protein
VTIVLQHVFLFVLLLLYSHFTLPLCTLHVISTAGSSDHGPGKDDLRWFIQPTRV